MSRQNEDKREEDKRMRQQIKHQSPGEAGGAERRPGQERCQIMGSGEGLSRIVRVLPTHQTFLLLLSNVPPANQIHVGNPRPRKRIPASKGESEPGAATGPCLQRTPFFPCRLQDRASLTDCCHLFHLILSFKRIRSDLKPTALPPPAFSQLCRSVLARGNA